MTASSTETFLPLPRPVPIRDPRVLERWKRRLLSFAGQQGLLLHATLALRTTRPFYVPEARDALKTSLAALLPSFVVKLEMDRQDSGFFFPHAHLLLPPLPEARDFLLNLRALGSKVKRLRYRGQLLPDPFSLFPQDRGKIILDDLDPIRDLGYLERVFDPQFSTLTTLKPSDHLARYFAKQTYRGGLSPVIEHNAR